MLVAFAKSRTVGIVPSHLLITLMISRVAMCRAVSLNLSVIVQELLFESKLGGACFSESKLGGACLKGRNWQEELALMSVIYGLLACRTSCVRC